MVEPLVDGSYSALDDAHNVEVMTGLVAMFDAARSVQANADADALRHLVDVLAEQVTRIVPT